MFSVKVQTSRRSQDFIDVWSLHLPREKERVSLILRFRGSESEAVPSSTRSRHGVDILTRHDYVLMMTPPPSRPWTLSQTSTMTTPRRSSSLLPPPFASSSP